MRNQTPHHRPRTTALAIRVDKILTTVNRRYTKAFRVYNATGSNAAWLKALHYWNDAQRREEALYKLLPCNLSPEALLATWREAEEDSRALSEMVAEDSNEAALYGDGPCGSMSRRHALHEANALAEALCTEHLVRNPPPRPPAPAPGTVDKVPF